MNYRELKSDALIEQVLLGWQPSQSGAVQEIVRRLGAHLNASTEIKETRENNLSFVIEIEGMYLRDMEQIPCLMIGKNGNHLQKLRTFLKESAHVLSFVLALSNESMAQMKKDFQHSQFLLLSIEQLKSLLKAPDSRQVLRQLLWQQISKRRMIPYNILFPPTRNMFFGRRHEFSRLQDENNTSFAIAGPGRIGKTSIITRYRDELKRTKDPLGPLTFFINFYDCSDHSDDGVARFFATKIEATKWSDRMTANQLVNFLLYQRNKLGSPLNLLMDEVDEVCQGEAFNAIISAARAKHCRIIVCGRGVLLKTMLNPKSPLQSRLELIQLQPLDYDSAKGLLVKPLTDLGFTLDPEELIIKEVLRLTGCLPHLLHIYGEKLASVAIEAGTNIISLDLVETVKWDFVVAQYFINSLFELKDPEVRIVGLSLIKSQIKDLPIPVVQKIAAQAGLNIDYVRTREICNDLLINNVLVWRDGHFRIANEGLYFYAKEMDFLENALKEAYAQLKSPA